MKIKKWFKISKKELLFITSFLMPLSIISQTTTSNFSHNELTNLINKHYIKYSSGQESTTSSSFAGLDIEKTEFTFSPIYITKNSNVWNAKFKGGITDGFASLFSNNKFNTNMSVDVQYNLNITHGGNIKVLGYMEVDYVKFRKDMINCLKTNLTELKAYINQDNILKNKGYVARIDTELLKITDNLTTDELKEIENDLFEIFQKLDTEINSISELTDTQKEITLDKFDIWSDKISEASKKRVTDFKYTKFRSQWLTFGVNVRNDEFRLLDRTKLFDEQIEKTNYVSFGSKIQYNSYQYSKFGNSIFFNIGLNGKRKSNFLDLTKIDVTETETIGSDGTTRNANERFNAYEGIYKEEINQIDLNADLFYFVNKFQNIGIHIYSNSRFMDFVKPSHDLGLGFVFPFKNKAKETTVINAEIYYTLKNIFNTKDTTFGLLERNNIGLRFTFPIDFNLN